MRVIGEIPHPSCKITLFHWNEKYIIKLEQEPLEQSYKVSAFDVNEQDIPLLLTDAFMEKVMKRFGEMGRDLREILSE